MTSLPHQRAGSIQRILSRRRVWTDELDTCAGPLTWLARSQKLDCTRTGCTAVREPSWWRKCRSVDGRSILWPWILICAHVWSAALWWQLSSIHGTIVYRNNISGKVFFLSMLKTFGLLLRGVGGYLMNRMFKTVLMLADIFDLVLVITLRRKCLVFFFLSTFRHCF